MLCQEGRKLFQAGETALAKAREAERARGISIRVGSSFLNPSRVLTDRWAPFREAYPQYKFSIVPYEDTKEQILSVIASLGERIDVLVGAFNSKSMQENAGYLLLGSHRLCGAVPKPVSYTHLYVYKRQVRALDGVDLAIQRGKFTAIIGTSGSGKSTLLHMSLIHI